jgi:hypothetical protein
MVSSSASRSGAESRQEKSSKDRSGHLAQRERRQLPAINDKVIREIELTD